SGYSGTPQVIISGPNDQQFPEIQAEGYATVVAGAVTAVTLTNPGLGYRSATVEFSGGNDGATASITLMPVRISRTSIETYQNHLWVGDDTKFSYTGAETVSDFSSAAGGGSTPITDAFLKEKLVRLIQANGILYRMGDSSINAIANVQASASGVTSFND